MKALPSVVVFGVSRVRCSAAPAAGALVAEAEPWVVVLQPPARQVSGTTAAASVSRRVMTTSRGDSNLTARTEGRQTLSSNNLMPFSMRAHLTFLALTAAVTSAEAQAPQERYVVMSSGQEVGHLLVTRSGTRVETEYRVDDNGRGPKIRERWQLGPDGLPRELTLSGTTTYGSPAKESFRLRNGRAEWRTLNDEGTVAAGRAAAYLPIEGSPYPAAFYLPALLAAPDRTLPTWPSGSVRAERVRDVPVGGGSQTVWALWGLGLSPTFVLADSAGRWKGTISSGYVVVPEELAGEAEALGRLAAGLESELLAEPDETPRTPVGPAGAAQERAGARPGLRRAVGADDGGDVRRPDHGRRAGPSAARQWGRDRGRGRHAGARAVRHARALRRLGRRRSTSRPGSRRCATWATPTPCSTGSCADIESGKPDGAAG